MSYVILAPHVDDEVIGNYTRLAEGFVDKVLYFFEVDEVRKKEALACAKRFKFKPVFMKDHSLAAVRKQFKQSDILLVPNIADSHSDHKAINMLAKRLPNTKRYYSVDMNVPKVPYAIEERDDKLRALRSLFPSQAPLFTDAKYSLFESDMPTDVVQTELFVLSLQHNARIGLSYFGTLPSEFVDAFYNEISKASWELSSEVLIREMLNLLSACSPTIDFYPAAISLYLGRLDIASAVYQIL